MELISKTSNFLYLIVSLVILLLVGAVEDQFPSLLGQHIFQGVTVITLASGIVDFRSTPSRVVTGIGFVVSVIVIVVLGVMLDIAGYSYLHLFVLLLFYLWATWLAAKQVLFSGEIDSNKIVGAICVYLLMGLIWAMLYLFIAQAIPGAFEGLEHIIWYENFSDAAYYSYVTLTTLGYGDIIPVAPIARFLVFMEAIVGAFYMAILVASLIGIRISKLQLDKD